MFTAAILYPTSAALLKWMMRGTFNLEPQGFVLETEQGMPLPHHMTINLGRMDRTLNPGLKLGCDALIRVRRLCHNPRIGVCAAEVVSAVEPLDRTVASLGGAFRPIKCMNSHPHITLCLLPGTKPKEANRIFLETDSIYTSLDETYELEATVEECP